MKINLTVKNKQIFLRNEDIFMGDKKHFLALYTPVLVLKKIVYSIENSLWKPNLEHIDDMLNHADKLMYPSKGKEEDFCQRYNALTDAIAYLSFAPHGVCIFGIRYEVIECQPQNQI